MKNVDRNGNVIPYQLQGITADVELITVDRAKELLSVMAKNRNIHTHQYNKYKTDLKSGLFTFCPAPIILNQNGEMIDGQHRCKAVVESGESFWGIVLYNVPDDSVIDRGAPRKTGEELYMRGIVDDEMSKSQYVAIARVYLRLKTNHRDITDTQIGEFLNQYQENIYEAFTVSQAGGVRSPICKKSGVQAALFAALECGVDYETLKSFTRIVNSGFATCEEDSAAIVLRNYIQQEVTAISMAATDSLCVYTEMCISDFVARKPRRRKYKDCYHVYIKKCPANLKNWWR